MSQFNGKIVLITGGTGGQGESHARRFIAEGAHVVLTDIADDKGHALAKSLGERAMFLHHDASSEADWKAVIAAVDKKFGKLDVLVNNAGIYKPASIADTTLAALRQMIDVNQIGVFLGMQHSAGLLAKSGNASIINISSLAGLRGFANAIGYVGTKWAVRGMTKTAAAELAPRGIRVNSIHPGFIATGMLDENDPKRGWTRHGADEASRQTRGGHRSRRVPGFGPQQFHHGCRNRHRRWFVRVGIRTHHHPTQAEEKDHGKRSHRDPRKDHLLTPDNSAFIVIDYQPIQVSSIRSMNQDELVFYIVQSAKAAVNYDLPIVHSTVNIQTGHNKPPIKPLMDVLARYPTYDRTTINSWEDVEFKFKG